jgi:hypothetical protein
LRAARYFVFGTTFAYSCRSKRRLPFSRQVYRVRIAETSCTAVDLDFQESPTRPSLIAICHVIMKKY